MIKRDQKAHAAYLFMQRLTWTTGAATDFVVRSLQHVLDQSGATTTAIDGVMNIDVASPEGEQLFHLKLHMHIVDPALASEMVASPDRLRVVGRFVTSNQRQCERLVAFIGHRLVAQLFPPDGETLRLEVKELPGARDLGNGVVALERLNFSVHTPLGSVWKDSMVH